MKSSFGFARTNALSCALCNQPITRGQAVIFNIKGRRLDSVNCTTCKGGKLEQEALIDNDCARDPGTGQD